MSGPGFMILIRKFLANSCEASGGFIGGWGKVSTGGFNYGPNIELYIIIFCPKFFLNIGFPSVVMMT